MLLTRMLIEIRLEFTRQFAADITLPDPGRHNPGFLHLALRLKLRTGRLPDDAMLFVGLDGALPSWKRDSKGLERLPANTGFHNLRPPMRPS